MKHLIKVFPLILLLLYACTTENEDSITMDKSEYLSIIEKYNLTPVSISEYDETTEKIKEISSPQQLEEFLRSMNAVPEEIPYNYIESYSPPILKTRSESHNIVRISRKNKDGTAHVYLDISKPEVIHSNYELGFMDAFVQYTHIAGSAYQAPLKIEFKVYGEGIVKLIWNQVELYRFSTIIDGSCDRDGRNGALGNF